MSDNVISLTLPTNLLVGGGTGGGNGLGFNFDLGPSADIIAANAYSFLGSQASGALAFEGNAIKGTQDFLTTQTQPIVNAVAKESDSYFSSLLGFAQQGMSVQNSIASSSINAENQTAQSSINSSSNSSGGGSLLDGLFGDVFGGCFITTAVCKYSGLPDDCHDLNVMRHWRDTWMRATPERSAMVDVYYINAPKYVAGIESKHDSFQKKVWSELRKLISGAVHHAERGSNVLALAYYQAAVAFAHVASGVYDE